MENTFMRNLKTETNFTNTDNGAITHKSTLNSVLDLFALGGAYRERTDDDCINLFKKAFEEDRLLALKALFYLRDCRGGQGERRFFRVCFLWLCDAHPQDAIENLHTLAEFGRWDDLIYCTQGEVKLLAFDLIEWQLKKDIQGNIKDISLLGKWLPSENASSKKTIAAAKEVRAFLEMTSKEYRKTLSFLRKQIGVVERLMSSGQWDNIEFDKLPSIAGLKYKDAFQARKETAERYEAFAANKETKVNASVLNPVNIIEKIYEYRNFYGWDNCNKEITWTDRNMFQKYWENLKDYYNGKEENAIAIVDTSGSMNGTPLNAAVGLGAYIAEHNSGAFADHFITFSSSPELVRFSGADIYDKAMRAVDAKWGMNTNLNAVFDLLLKSAINTSVKKEDMPKRLYIFSDMEFDSCIMGAKSNRHWYEDYTKKSESKDRINTLVEGIEIRWQSLGYELPEIVFWNLNAMNNNIPAIGGKFSYISGFSPVMIEQVLSGKTGIDLMLEKLNSERYSIVH